MAALTLAACSDSDDPGSSDTATTSTSTTTTTVPAGPTLATDTDDVEAAMRSLLEFDFWTEANPEAAQHRTAEWVVEGSPYAERVEAAITEQVAQGTYATGHPEVLDVAVENQTPTAATVLVWARSDGFRFEGPPEFTFDDPPFERTLFVFELQRPPGDAWRIYERRIPTPA